MTAALDGEPVPVSSKPRITLVISALKAGGAERVMSTMANYWAERGYHITLITLSPTGDDFYALDARINRLTINGIQKSPSTWRAVTNNITRVRRLRRAIKSVPCDVVISFMPSTNVLTIAATRGVGVPVVVSEHNDPLQRRLGRVWEGLRRLSYPRAQAVIVLTAAARNWATGFVSAEAVRVIPNPVRPLNCAVMPDVQFDLSGRFILAMGRFAPVKGFDLLLRAFASSQARRCCRLVILGDGPERIRLEGIARDEGIDDVVLMPGQLRHIDQVLKQAEIFVLSSRSEGLPNALLEAMACGVPIVSFDCSSGPREILRRGERGILVPAEDVAAMAAAIDRLVGNPGERRSFAMRAKGVVEEYQLERVMGLWDETLESVKWG